MMKGGIAGLMQQAQKMQERMQKAQEELAGREVVRRESRIVEGVVGREDGNAVDALHHALALTPRRAWC